MALFTTWTEQAEIAARMVVPYGLLAILLLFNMIVLVFSFAGAVKAPLFLMAVYYWSIYRPTLLPIWLVFLAGCILDLISGLPLGLNALIFVITRWRVADQRRFLMSQNFFMIWVGFSLISFIAHFVQWIIIGIIYLAWPPLSAVWFTVFSGTAFFPLVYVALHLTHKVLPEPVRALSLKAQG